jgi:hypothetical protein
MIKNRKEALALHLMLDYSEVENYRYHYGHTTIPVYAIDEDYYCVTRKGEKPAKHRYSIEWIWYEQKDSLCNFWGYKIYKATSNI